MTDAALIQIPIWGGIDESVDSLRTPANRMRAAQNCIFPSRNSTAKRYGFQPTTLLTDTGATLRNVKRIMNCAGEPVVTDGVNAYGYTAGPNRWVNHGRVSPCIATREEVSTGYARAIQADALGNFYGQMLGYAIADANGQRVIVWQIGGTAAQGGGIYAQVTDIATGEAIYPAQQLSNSPASLGTMDPNATVRAVGDGTLVQVGYQNGNPALKLRQWDTVARTWTNELTVVTGFPVVFDMCLSVGGGGDFFLVYNDINAGSITLQRRTSAQALATSNTVAVGLAAGVQAPCAVRAVFSETVWVAWVIAASSTVKMATFDTTSCILITAPFNAIALAVAQTRYVVGIERRGPTQATVTLGAETGGLAWALCSTTAQIQQNGFFSSASEAVRYVPISKPVVASNGLVYILTLQNVQFGSSLVLLELGDAALSTPLPAAMVAARSAINDWANAHHQQICDFSIPADRSQTKLVTLGPSVNSSGTVGISTITFDFAHPGLYQAVTLGATTYITGGVLGSYDGQRLTETGFVFFPPRPGFPSSSTVGGLLGKNKYHYIQLWRYRTYRGEVERCLPPTFDPLLTDLSGSATTTNANTIRLQTLDYATTKQGQASYQGNPVFLELYRTAFNGSIEGNYYLCGVVPNQTGAGFIDFVDGMSDALLQTQPLLYTVGNVLEFDSLPSTRFLCVHNQRLFSLCDEGRVIWYTTAFVTGEKPRWNDGLKLIVPGGDGNLVALASLDGRLLAFTSTAIFIFTGDGPNDTGAGETWNTPVRMPFGVGCVDPRAICVTPLGVVFNSQKGIYLYDRSGQVQWLGERIQRTLATYPVVTSIVHYEADGFVLVSLKATDTDGAAGVTLCWDYRHDAWSTWTISTDVGNGFGSRSAESIGGTYYAVFNDGSGNASITKYTPGVWTDATAATWITMIVESGWISQQDLQSYGRIARIQVMMQYAGAHDLVLTKYVDYSATPDSTVTFTNATLAALSLEQVRTGLVQQKCQSVLLRIADQDPHVAGTGRGPVVESVLFKLRARRSEYKRLGSSQTG